MLFRILLAVLTGTGLLSAQSPVVVERIGNDQAGSSFSFKQLPPPSRGDAAESARLSLTSGSKDPNGGDLSRVTDGRLPAEADAPDANFFFNAGSGGGSWVMDLGKAISIGQIRSYSWHPAGRASQLYQLFGFAGDEAKYEAPKAGSDPTTNGWKRIARVDTRDEGGGGFGQHAAAIGGNEGTIGKYRYLLFQVEQTRKEDPFAHTFFSEVDVIEAGSTNALALAASAPTNNVPPRHYATNQYHFTLESEVAPDLTEWAEKSIMPVVLEWYPKLVAMLPSEGYEAPTNVILRFRENMGGTPASAGGNRINCNAGWFRRNQKGEAVGSVVHEMVHVVQQYGLARRNNPNATRTPGWLTEGIPDYIRWFLYEPETKGAEITERNLSRAKYDASYRITGNFLDWVARNYDSKIVLKLNAAAREGKYQESLWKEWTGKTVQELGSEWFTHHEAKVF